MKSEICATLFRHGTSRCARQSAASPGISPEKTKIVGARAERRAQRRAFLGQRHEEAARAGGGEGRRHGLRAEAVGVRLDHRRGLHGGGGEGVERPPVGGDGVEVDGEAGAGDGGGSGRMAQGSAFAARGQGGRYRSCAVENPTQATVALAIQPAD